MVTTKSLIREASSKEGFVIGMDEVGMRIKGLYGAGGNVLTIGSMCFKAHLNLDVMVDKYK